MNRESASAELWHVATFEIWSARDGYPVSLRPLDRHSEAIGELSLLIAGKAVTDFQRVNRANEFFNSLGLGPETTLFASREELMLAMHRFQDEFLMDFVGNTGRCVCVKFTERWGDVGYSIHVNHVAAAHGLTAVGLDNMARVEFWIPRPIKGDPEPEAEPLEPVVALPDEDPKAWKYWVRVLEVPIHGRNWNQLKIAADLVIEDFFTDGAPENYRMAIQDGKPMSQEGFYEATVVIEVFQ